MPQRGGVETSGQHLSKPSRSFEQVEYFVVRVAMLLLTAIMFTKLIVEALRSF